MKNILESQISLKEKLFIFNSFIIKELENINDFFNKNSVIQNKLIDNYLKQKYEGCFENGIFNYIYFKINDCCGIKFFDEKYPFCVTVHINLLENLLDKHLHKSNNCVYGLLDIPVKNESIAEGITKSELPVTYISI